MGTDPFDAVAKLDPAEMTTSELVLCLGQHSGALVARELGKQFTGAEPPPFDPRWEAKMGEFATELDRRVPKREGRAR